MLPLSDGKISRLSLPCSPSLNSVVLRGKFVTEFYVKSVNIVEKYFVPHYFSKEYFKHNDAKDCKGKCCRFTQQGRSCCPWLQFSAFRLE